MHPLQKLYCRAFQLTLRAALPLLPYRKPQPLTHVEQVPPVLARAGVSQVLLVTDPGVAAHGLTRELEAALAKAKIGCAVFDRTVANPTTATVEEAAALYRSANCSAIIALGGGSSMDCGKAVGIRIAKPRRPLGKCRGILRVRTRLPLLIAIPTTAGTGSETTLAAVITDAETRHKYAINDFPLIPRYAVLDAKLTVSLPPALTASTGLDALTHAVEAYIGRSTTADTRRDAMEAVKRVFAYLPRAYENGGDLEAREQMLQAAYLAGCAFTKSYVGYVHAVAHSLGGEYNVPHGYANAVLLDQVLTAYGPAVYKKLAELARGAGIAQKDAGEEEAAQALIQAIRAMKRRFSIGDTIPQLRRADIPKLAGYAAREANPLYPVPVLMDRKELEGLYLRILEE